MSWVNVLNNVNLQTSFPDVQEDGQWVSVESWSPESLQRVNNFLNSLDVAEYNHFAELDTEKLKVLAEKIHTVNESGIYSKVELAMFKHLMQQNNITGVSDAELESILDSGIKFDTKFLSAFGKLLEVFRKDTKPELIPLIVRDLLVELKKNENLAPDIMDIAIPSLGEINVVGDRIQLLNALCSMDSADAIPWVKGVREGSQLYDILASIKALKNRSILEQTKFYTDKDTPASKRVDFLNDLKEISPADFPHILEFARKVDPSLEFIERIVGIINKIKHREEVFRYGSILTPGIEELKAINKCVALRAVDIIIDVFNDSPKEEQDQQIRTLIPLLIGRPIAEISCISRIIKSIPLKERMQFIKEWVPLLAAAGYDKQLAISGPLLKIPGEGRKECMPLLFGLENHVLESINERIEISPKDRIKFLKDCSPLLKTDLDLDQAIEGIKNIPPDWLAIVLALVKKNAPVVRAILYNKLLALIPTGDFLIREMLKCSSLDGEKILKELTSCPQENRDSLLSVLVGEALVLDNVPLPQPLIDQFLKKVEISLPLILARPSLMQHLINRSGTQIEAAIKELDLAVLPAEQRVLLIPFMPPHLIQQLINGLTPDEANRILAQTFHYEDQDLSAEAALHQALIDLARLPEEHKDNKRQQVEQMLPLMPYGALALIARDKPDLITPYLTYMQNEQLAAVLPFLNPAVVLGIISPGPHITMSWPKLYDWVKRSPLLLKKEIYKKMTPLPFNNLIEQIKGKKPTGNEILILRTVYAGLQQQEQSYAKVLGLFKQEGDAELTAWIKKEEARTDKPELEVLMRGLTLDSETIPKEFEDPETGDPMRIPIILPGSQERIDESTLNSVSPTGERLFPKRETATGIEIKNIYNQQWYPEATYKVDEDLKQRLDEFHNKNS